jgi:hypothetical protein
VKYMVQVEIDPIAGIDIEAQPAKIQEWVDKWQALNPLAFYFHTTRRAITIVVDVPDEDAIFEAIHATWVLAKSYPVISPVMNVDEFPGLLQRALG